MGTVRIPEVLLRQTHRYLFSGPGEHFAFFLAKASISMGEPVFLVDDVHLVDEEETQLTPDGWSVSTEGLVRAVNSAVRADAALIEAHNHSGGRPRFSKTDRDGLNEFVPYILDSLPGRPYAATVWSDQLIHGEFFTQDGRNGLLSSIVSPSFDRYRQLASIDEPSMVAGRFARQLPWFTEEGQRLLGHLKVGVVGASGTGSPTIELLRQLGVRHFVIVDPDFIEAVNLNRIGYATPADVGDLKVANARRHMKSSSPETEVVEIAQPLQSHEALDSLKGVDLLFGCVDNDGARLVLNELALAYRIPYFDLGTGLEMKDGALREAGGRVAVVVPGGPCLVCMGLIDPIEARNFLDPPEYRQEQVRLGYVAGEEIPAPAVAPINAQVAAMAVNELAIWITGTRQLSPLQEFDLLGTAHAVASQRTAPRMIARDLRCVECVKEGLGDGARIERFILNQDPSPCPAN